MQASAIGYLLQHVTAMMQRQSDQMLQERLGIGMSQYRILLMVEHNSSVGQRVIADNLGQTEASISRQVKLLHEKGMLATHVDPSERRRHITALTAKGIKVTMAAREILDQFYEPLFGSMTAKEQDQLYTVLTHFHEAICAPGKPTACDRAFAIETVYDNQNTA